MSHTLQNKETEFDDIYTTLGNETYHTFNLMDHVNLPYGKESTEILNDDSDLSNMLHNFLHLTSRNDDSNEESRKLFNTYRQQYIK